MRRGWDFALVLGLFSLTTFLLLVSSARAAVTTSPVHYTMIDLGSLGGQFAEGLKINNSGVIVGDSPLANTQNTHAFRSSGVINPATDDLGLPTGFDANSNSLALAINSSGQIAAEAIPAGASGGIAPYHTYAIPSGGAMSSAVDIQTLGGAFTFAENMNDSGQIAGWSGLSAGNWHAYLYTPGSGMLDLGAPNSSYSHAYDVNNSGQVVGWVDGGSSSQAFRTKPNSPITVQDYLGTLGGSYVSAKAINDAGQVTGQSDITGNSVSHVFRTKPNASINPATDDVGGLTGSLWNDPFDINNEGDVVGWSFLTSINSTHGFVAFGDANVMYDLNDLVDNRGNWVFDLAEGINDQGAIVARAELNGTGFDHAFLLTPVPEPTVAMLGLPLLLLIGRWFRISARSRIVVR